MPGSIDTHGRTAEHRQYARRVANSGAPSDDTVTYKCSVMDSNHELSFTEPNADCELCPGFALLP